MKYDKYHTFLHNISYFCTMYIDSEKVVRALHLVSDSKLRDDLMAVMGLGMHPATRFLQLDRDREKILARAGSYKDLAEKTGLHRNSISNFLLDKSDVPMSTYISICSALGLSVELGGVIHSYRSKREIAAMAGVCVATVSRFYSGDMKIGYKKWYLLSAVSGSRRVQVADSVEH